MDGWLDCARWLAVVEIFEIFFGLDAWMDARRAGRIERGRARSW